MPTGLSDDKVSSELAKMVEFINKEAEEKAKEIQIKADEEYEAEKSSLVRSETATIDQSFALRYKQAKLAQQIVKSTVSNKTRLKVLEAKEETVDSIVQEAAKKIKELPKNAAKYEKLLAGLIAEAALTLKESEIVVTGRKSDKSVLEKAAKGASDLYKSKSDKELKIDVEEGLSEESSGGVIVATANKKVSIDSTLDTRLKLLVDKALPLIRLELFGPSANRRFFD